MIIFMSGKPAHGAQNAVSVITFAQDSALSSEVAAQL
jgi:hypothetical protein